MEKEFLEIKCTSKIDGLAFDAVEFIKQTKDNWKKMLVGAEAACKTANMINADEHSKKSLAGLIVITKKIVDGEPISKSEIFEIAYAKRTLDFHEILTTVKGVMRGALTASSDSSNIPREVEGIVDSLKREFPGVDIRVGRMRKEFDLEELIGIDPKVRRDN